MVNTMLVHVWSLDRCILIIAHVVDNARSSKASVNVQPLEKYLNEVTNLAKRYHGRGVFSRMARFRSDGKRIQVHCSTRSESKKPQCFNNQNLLPTCDMCRNPSVHRVGTRGPADGVHFLVEGCISLPSSRSGVHR